MLYYINYYTINTLKGTIMSRSKLALAATTGMLLAGCGGETKETAPIAPKLPSNPIHLQSEIGRASLEWVRVTPKSGDPEDAECYVDMSHILKGRVITRSLSNTGGTPCDAGDRILPNQIPKNYNRVLARDRKAWEELQDAMAQLITDGKDESIVEAKDFEWVSRVGQVDFYGNQPDPYVDFNDGKGGREYGPSDTCSIGSSSQEIRVVGQVKDDEYTYNLGIVLSGDSPGAPCDPGNLVLLPVPPRPNQSQAAKLV